MTTIRLEDKDEIVGETKVRLSNKYMGPSRVRFEEGQIILNGLLNRETTGWIMPMRLLFVVLSSCLPPRAHGSPNVHLFYFKHQ